MILHRGRLIAAILAVLMVCLSVPVVPAEAQAPTPAGDENCLACHTEQYTLYDSGKYYCLCEASMQCVYCHAGRTGTLDKALAHEGLAAHPTFDNAQQCQSCHAEDYAERAAAFGAIAGIHPTPQPAPAINVNTAALTNFAARQPQSWLRLESLEPWRLAGIAILVLVLLLDAAFGYRCYKADCLRRAIQ